MYKVRINGIVYQAEQDKTLLRFLRDDLHLTAAKDGCSEGACGACTVIIDGETVKACTKKLSQLKGCKVVTVEGLSWREQTVYTYAFSEAGAVQCGFCIPGMVLCAKALIDKNNDPTEEEIAWAIRDNYCRCTGYVKIKAAIRLAAKLIREDAHVPARPRCTGIGQRTHRIDAKEKILGTGLYPDDLYFDGMLMGGAVRVPYARCRILDIDVSRAKQLPGVVGIYFAEDIPGSNLTGHIKPDWPVLIPKGGISNTIGDAVCLIAAEDEATLEKAKKLVKLKVEQLPAVFSPEDALKEDAVLVHPENKSNILSHEHLVRGNVDAEIAKAAHVITRHYSTPWNEHAFLEPECALAIANKETQDCTIYTTDQGVYATQHECCTIMGVRPHHMHIVNMLVGGGFGGKEDLTVQHHACIMAWHTGRPVKVRLSRQESLNIHPKRHAMEIDMTTACDENGYIKALKAVVVSDTGAYASLGGPVLQRACTHAAGPYNFQSIDIDGTAVYTNNPPAGAFRGFGVTQTCFASESNLNLLAEMVGISPWEIRYRNAIRPGQILPNNQRAFENTALVETLEALKPIYDANEGHVGIACCMKNAGTGVGLEDWGRVKLTVEDGRVFIRSGASCIGQGLGTTLTMIAVECTGLEEEKICYPPAETIYAPDSGVTSGSRQTLVTGEALRRACELLNRDLKQFPIEQLNGREYVGTYLAKTDKMGAIKKNPVSHVGYGYATQMAVLDPETHRVKTIYAAHDVGRAINPLNVEGQIEGGAVMGAGYALQEHFPLKDGVPQAKYGSLGLFRGHDAPEIVPIIVEKNTHKLALGAIGCGEITSIPTAPAIAGAYYAVDHKLRTSLPLTDTPYEERHCVPYDQLTTCRPYDVVFRPDSCIFCGLCARTCPAQAIQVNRSEKTWAIDRQSCLHCGMCSNQCPKKCLSLFTH
jgi:selenium-dependent xanthine dehydrogenase